MDETGFGKPGLFRGCRAALIALSLMALVQAPSHAAGIAKLSFVTTPTAASQPFSVLMRLDDCTTPIAAYDLRVYFTGAFVTINDATDASGTGQIYHDVYPIPPGAPYADTVNFDGDTATDSWIQNIMTLAGNYVQPPGPITIFSFTTKPTYNPATDRILIKVVRGEDFPAPPAEPFIVRGWFDENGNEFPVTYGTDVPVGVSRFSVA